MQIAIFPYLVCLIAELKPMRMKYLALICVVAHLHMTSISTAEDAVVSGPTNETITRTIEDGGTGSYKAIVVSDSSLATHAIYRPADLSSFGDAAKLPILAWGNGACANSSQEHQNFLSEIASRGYLVVAIGPLQEESQGGRGGRGGGTKSSLLTDAIDWAVAQNANEQSIYFGKLDTSKIAVAGMSCGGLQALEVSPDPRVSTTMVCNSGVIGGGGPSRPRVPATPSADKAEEQTDAPKTSGENGDVAAPPAPPARRPGGMPGMPAVTKELLTKLHAPILYLLGGESDIAYQNGMDDYRRIEKLPAFVANMDVGHGGTYGRPHGGEYATVAAAWLDWQLKGDQEAAKMFVGEDFALSKAENWKVEKKNIP